MAVAHSPAGFTGTVDQVDEARRFAVGGGGRFRVNGSGDWALTAHATVNRTVNIAAGMAAACGVLDLTTAVDTVTFTANAGGSDRFDAVVASFDWATMTVTFRVVAGTTVPPVIVRTGTTVDTTKINWLPGTRYDAVLGIIRARPGVTILAPADLYDCRPWGSWAMPNILSAAYGGMVDVDPNGRIRENATGFTYEWNGTAWVPGALVRSTASTGAATVKIVYGTATASFAAASFATATIDYTSAGFTAAPAVVPGIGSANTYGATVGVDGVTATSAFFVARHATSITASIPIYWYAVGI